jgi:hypothetical protein
VRATLTVEVVASAVFPMERSAIVGVTVIVDDAVVLAFVLVEDADSQTVAQFVIVVVAVTEGVMPVILSVATVPEAISLIFQSPVEDA